MAFNQETNTGCIPAESPVQEEINSLKCVINSYRISIQKSQEFLRIAQVKLAAVKKLVK